MSNRRTIVVRQDFDVILARSCVRDLARKLGLGTTDQARISLATSSVARAIGLGNSLHGQITMEGLNGGERAGVCVTCRAESDASCEMPLRRFSDAKFMTDELTVEELPTNETQVVLVKWAK